MALEKDNKNPELVITRTFNSPRELVWKAWTEPERLMQWWGPKGFKMTVAKMDLRPGGVFHYGLRSEGGQEMWGKFVYREIVEPDRMVFINSFSDEKGGITRHPMSATWPLQVFNDLTLTEQAGKTTLTIRGGPYSATEEERKTFEDGKDSIQKGFAETFGQLDAYLAQAGNK
jgi:uncharacterized protein YndB with AHSA1/START domain